MNAGGRIVSICKTKKSENQNATEVFPENLLWNV